VDKQLLRLFQRQVALQCRGVLIATGQLNEALAQKDTPAVWTAVQSLLTSAANISKACWGQRGKHLEAPRKLLRDSLQIDDNSPLNQVTMRNKFEHFDEKLDEWWKSSTDHHHLDVSVMPPSAIQGISEKDMFRVLDPTTMEVVFWGERFDLQAIVNEVSRLLVLAEAEAAKPHWVT
jgi:hypothetical protein